MSSEQKKPFARQLKGADLTAKQRAFVVALVRQGCTPTRAAQEAGYAVPRQSGYDLMQLANVQEAVRFERSRYAQGYLANVATRTLYAVMTDDAAPASARVAAARAVLEVVGELGGHRLGGSRGGDELRPVDELTFDELEGMIARCEAERAAIAAPATH